MTAINIAVAGLGYWGPNLARNFAGLADTHLHTLRHSPPARLTRFSQQNPNAKPQSDFQAVLRDPEVDAVVIATPAASHFTLACAALGAGKHVMVEKPLAQTSAQCRELIALAEAGGLTLMTGHVFL